MKEKWNLKITTQGDSLPEDDEKRSVEFLHEHVLQRTQEHPFIEFEKTEEEVKIIQEMNDVYSSIFLKFGLEDQRISLSDVHVVDENSFKSVRGINIGGTTRGTQIYVPRIEGAPVAKHTLSHEMAHAFAFSRKSFLAQIEITNKQKQYNYSDEQDKRTGYHFVADGINQFLGLNECVTEYIGSVVHEAIKHKINLVTTNLKELPIDITAYIPAYILLEFLVKRYSQKDNDENEIWDEIARGYFTGDMRWVNKLKIVHPEIARILRDMGKTDKAALHAAEELDLKDAIEAMKFYFEV